MNINPEKIKCVVFDFANTLCSDLYFNIPPCKCDNWTELLNTHVFDKFHKNVIETNASRAGHARHLFEF